MSLSVTPIDPRANPAFDNHEAVYRIRDDATGLNALVAIHSTKRGPAAGGTRWWTYADDDAALTDALRLSRGMSFKNAMAGLPAGGGKGVIVRGADKTPALMEAFGRAIETLAGRYVTAEDVGITEADMVAVARATRHVTGLPRPAGSVGGDPGPATSQGVFVGMRAAIAAAYGKRSFEGTHVAIQGVGSVGLGVAERLHAAGARLTVADVDAGRVRLAVERTGARVVSVDEIARVEADVFSPCALGAVLSADTIPELAAGVVAGAANNQLAGPTDGARLHARGIVYAPDYVIIPWRRSWRS